MRPTIHTTSWHCISHFLRTALITTKILASWQEYLSLMSLRRVSLQKVMFKSNPNEQPQSTTTRLPYVHGAVELRILNNRTKTRNCQISVKIIGKKNWNKHLQRERRQDKVENKLHSSTEWMMQVAPDTVGCWSGFPVKIRRPDRGRFGGFGDLKSTAAPNWGFILFQSWDFLVWVDYVASFFHFNSSSFLSDISGLKNHNIAHHGRWWDPRQFGLSDRRAFSNAVADGEACCGTREEARLLR